MNLLPPFDIQALLTAGIVSLSIYSLFLFMTYLVVQVHDEWTAQQHRRLDQLVKAVQPVMEAQTESNLIPKIEKNLQTVQQQASQAIDRLSKRQARKLCSPLGIPQKTNGVELTLDLMKASIRRQFKDNPQQVIGIIRDRLPELLPQDIMELQQLNPAC
jgi:hypothetical protein